MNGGRVVLWAMENSSHMRCRVACPGASAPFGTGSAPCGNPTGVVHALRGAGPIRGDAPPFVTRASACFRPILHPLAATAVAAGFTRMTAPVLGGRRENR